MDEGARRGYDVHEITHYGCTGGLGNFIGPHGFELTIIEERRRIEHLAVMSDHDVVAEQRRAPHRHHRHPGAKESRRHRMGEDRYCDG